MVAAYHYGGRGGAVADAWGEFTGPPVPDGAPPDRSFGCLGVQIFFVISGFVICTGGWGRSLTSFFAPRVRLLPAYGWRWFR